MISAAESTAGKATASIYELKVTLVGPEPPVWRSIQVPGDAPLDWLHAVLQVAIGWTNSHLHEFKVGGGTYSDTRVHFAEFDDDPEILEERKFRLDQIAPRELDVIEYQYDFGDSWEHEIKVERILAPDPACAEVASCIGGARACPPEDCGGVGGYDELLRILKNKRHEEHKRMKEWLGREFDAEAFDLDKTNHWLRKLKWPRVTDAQLRKVLMSRYDFMSNR